MVTLRAKEISQETDDAIFKNYRTLKPEEVDPASLQKSIESVRENWHHTFGMWLPSNKNAAILDVGCGAGEFLYWLRSQRYTHCEGVDLSYEQIEKAKAIGIENVTGCNALEFLKSHPEKFQFIIMRDFLEHIDREQVVYTLELVRGALTPGGTCVIQVPNGASPFFGSTHCGDFTHKVLFGEGSIRQVLKLCGFETLAVFGIEPYPKNLKNWIRFLVWKCIKQLMLFCIAIESGSHPRIVSQVMVAVAKK